MKSMTGYGEASRQGKRAKITVQLRTLNHRHLDLQLRLPREYLAFEEDIRRKIRQKISRGRVELFIVRSPFADLGRALALDYGLAGQYLEAIGRARKKFALKGDIDLSLFFGLPELFHFRERDREGEEEGNLVGKAVDAALGNLHRSRQREGMELQRDIRSQLLHLQKICGEIARQAKGIGRRNESLFLKREPDAQRLDTGVDGSPQPALFKGDVNEEVVRLKTHVTTLARLLKAREPVGKRIEFLLQEIQRELNTIGSKVPQLSIVQLVLAGKERAEKIREQIQNIE